MASIYPKNGTWYLSWYEKNGVRVAKSLKLKSTRANKKLAEQHRYDKERELRNGVISRYNASLAEAIQLFLDRKKNKEQNTINRYRQSLKLFANYMHDVNVSTITDQQIVDYEDYLQTTKYKTGHKEKRYSLATIESYIKDLRIFIRFLKSQNVAVSCTVRNEKNNPGKHITVIPKKAVEQILDRFKQRNIWHYRFLKLLYLTGFRKGEALGLSWNDVNFDEGIIRLWNEKDNREDVFPLSEELREFLAEFRSTGKIFPFAFPAQIAKILRKEFGYSFKDFRSTFASEKAKHFRAFELKELLRHKKVQTSEKYYVNVDVRSLADRL